MTRPQRQERGPESGSEIHESARESATADEWSSVLAGLTSSEQALRQAAMALGPALLSVERFVEPALARSVQAEQNYYDAIESEFGLLSATEAGRALGSRASTSRNLASNARRKGRIAAITRGNQVLYPGFQFDRAGALPVMWRLLDLATESGRSEAGVVHWLCAPSTYFADPEGTIERRPVDVLRSDPDRVLDVARSTWNIAW